MVTLNLNIFSTIVNVTGLISPIKASFFILCATKFFSQYTGKIKELHQKGENIPYI